MCIRDRVLAAHDSALARWPDRGALPLRVWIQPMARVRDWTPNHVAIVRDAFIEWGESGVPLAFSSVSYTHLTLPTSDLVEISVVAVSLKNNKNKKKKKTDRYSLKEDEITTSTQL